MNENYGATLAKKRIYNKKKKKTQLKIVKKVANNRLFVTLPYELYGLGLKMSFSLEDYFNSLLNYIFNFRLAFFSFFLVLTYSFTLLTASLSLLLLLLYKD